MSWPRPDLRTELGRFRDAAGFLTRLPVPAARVHDPAWLVRSAKYFPLVGLVVGAIGAAILAVASSLWSGALPALLSTAATIGVTGALHEDGLADSADSLGGRTRQARLAIMKDSRLGTFGASALALSLAIKVSALAALAPAMAAWGLIASHAGGRLAAVLTLATQSHAGDAATSRSSYSPERMDGPEIALAILFGGLPLVLVGPGPALMGLVAAGALALGGFLIMRRALGGYTGDVLGAVEQLFEIGFLLGVAAAVDWP